MGNGKWAILLIAFCFLLSTFTCYAQTPIPAPIISVEGITEYQLPNGFKILLFPDASRPTLTVNLTILVGSRQEGYGETGMAHLLEHMLFKGTPTNPDPKKLFSEKGARWNGTTDYDRTNYFETVPANDDNLDWAIAFEADRLINANIKAEDLASEFTVVRNEFEMHENNPMDILDQRLTATAFDWHNYGKSVIGNRTDIERVPVENLRAFYKKYYQPDNSLLIIAGKFDSAKALAAAEKYFSPIPKPTRVLAPTYTEEPPQDGQRTVTLRRVGGGGGIVGVLYHVPAGSSEDFAPVEVLARALATTPTGELYKALVETGKAASIDGWAAALHDPGVMEYFATLKEGQSLTDARDTMLQTLDRVAAEGVSQEQVDRAKRRFAAERKRDMTDTARVAIDLSNWAAQGDWRLFFLIRDRMEHVAIQDVQRVAREYIRTSNSTVGLYIPTTQPDRTPIPAAPDLAAVLKDYHGRALAAVGEQLDPDPLKIEARVQRPDPIAGVKVALLPKLSSQNMVNLRLTLHFGNQENLLGTRTASKILPELLLRGTRQLTRQQFQDQLDADQATLEVAGKSTILNEQGQMTYVLKAPREHLLDVIGLLQQALHQPVLGAEEFELLRREQFAALEADRHDPGALGIYALRRALRPYPATDSRYEPTLEEDLKDLQSLTLDQVRKLYDQYIGAQAGELAIVGDFEPAPTLNALRTTLSNWSAAMPTSRILQTSFPTAVVDQTILTPDKSNALYYAGLTLKMSDNDPDFPAVVLANQVLGGSGGSRLFAQVRDRQGLSYGVGSRLATPGLEPYTLIVQNAIYNPAVVEKVKASIAHEVEVLGKDPITPTELSAAKESYLQARAMARVDDAALTVILSQDLYANRTLKYDADIDTRIRALAAEEVVAAAAKYIKVDQRTVITAGDFAKNQINK